jgi:hypothetical protein
VHIVDPNFAIQPQFSFDGRLAISVATIDAKAEMRVLTGLL